ncbi:MAG: hypothetical protein ABIK31_01600 [candidate division WOR-3 bacterium]
MKTLKKIITAFLFCISILTMQYSKSFGQNLILLHNKVGKGDYVAQTGKKIKIETIDKQVIKGKIIEIKDSSIEIGSKKTAIEVRTDNIKYFYFREPNGWQTSIGIICAYSGLTLTPPLYAGISDINGYPMAPLVVGASVIGISAAGLGVYYGLFHKKKFDTQLKYDLLIVKAK